MIRSLIIYAKSLTRLLPVQIFQVFGHEIVISVSKNHLKNVNIKFKFYT